MSEMAHRGVTLLNAQLGTGEVISLRIEGARIVGLRESSHPGDICIDLRGDRVLPGLINSHDHLQLNALPLLKYRDRYSNVEEWIDDIRPRLSSDPMLLANREVPHDDRLLLGGIKNLLSGVTTVAHHDPLYPSLRSQFPTRVVTRYGWSHSLAMDGEEAVRRSHRACPADQPWIIHAAEGVDAAAGRELTRLESLGCITPNTLLVHGLALDGAQHARLAAAGAGLIWCPASNLHLFGGTVDVGTIADRRHVVLGSDSRLSGSRDLLAELHVARESSRLKEAELESLVTTRPARMLRLFDRGVLEQGALADILVLPADVPLSRAQRADVRLVLLGGEPQYADSVYAAEFECDVEHAQVEVDGRAKWLPEGLISRLENAAILEPGLEWRSGAFAPNAPALRECVR